MIGTGLAIGLGLLSAGTQVASSVIQSKAANKAAKTQVAAADKGLDVTNRMYDQSRADLAPWLNVSAEALNRLNTRMGGQATVGPMATGAPMAGAPMGGGAIQPLATSRLGTGGRMPSAQPAQGQMVMLQAPNGQRQAVPKEQADHFIAEGAELVA